MNTLTQNAGSDVATQPKRGPLSGLIVVDLTRVLAGPYCTMVLADLGARVIKVEQPGVGDDSRAYGPFINGASAYFMSLNRGKESIALDLKAEGDRAVFEKLLATADVVVENFRPGTMEKLGYGWEQLRLRYPRLIYAAASGFGHTGPYSKRAAYDMVVQAMGGVMSITGHPGQPPVRVGTSIGDITAGLFTAIGINAALLHRATTGESQKIDVAMLDCQVAILENAISRYAASGEIAGPLGARHPSITPFAGFEASDGWLVLAAGNDVLFKKVAHALELPAIATDPRFATNALRCENWGPLFAVIGEVIKTRPIREWLSVLDAAGIPCGPINTIDKVLSDPQVVSRMMVVKTEDPETGPVIMAGNPIKLSAFTDSSIRRPAPRLDASRQGILALLEQPPKSTAPPDTQVTSVLTRQSGGRSVRYLEAFWRSLKSEPEPKHRSPSGLGGFMNSAGLLCDALLSARGEVSGTAIASQLVELCKSATREELHQFVRLLADRFSPDPQQLQRAFKAWEGSRSTKDLINLIEDVEPPRQELFRRMNMARGGTELLVGLRAMMLADENRHADAAAVDADLKHLFGSWFNRGFLELKRIDWHTPAAVLEKLIQYEAVHAIDGWIDLRRRLEADRRCFAFFHPSLPDEPLIFVEVALTDQLSASITPILRAEKPRGGREHWTTAIFYSISNCQPGLRGISLGNFLIKQVVTELQAELPDIKTFATLSPIPGFRRWCENNDVSISLPQSVQETIKHDTGSDLDRTSFANWLSSGSSQLRRDVTLQLCAAYLTETKMRGGRSDPVARFHLGNGARIERINWSSDPSPKGISESYGLMVNYLYDLAHIDDNHERFAEGGMVVRSDAVDAMLRIAEPTSGVQMVRSHVDAALNFLNRKKS